MGLCDFPKCDEFAMEIHRTIGGMNLHLCKKHHRIMHTHPKDLREKPKCFGHFFGKDHREDQACIVNPKCKWRFKCAFRSGIITPEKVVFT